MATSGDGFTPYESRGAGGKFRKRPLRRSIPATPYTRPPTAVRKENPSMLKKLVDPASRLIYAGAQRLFDVFRKSLPPLSLRPPETSKEPQNVVQKQGQSGNAAAATGIAELEQMLEQKTFTRSEVERLTSLLHSKTTNSPSDELPEQHGDKRDNLHAVTSTPFVTSRVLEEEIASPAELAKYYMGSRPTSQAPRQDLKLLPTTSMTPVAQKTAISLRSLENGVTPRSRGRSAMYTMARRPYSGSLSTYSQQALKRRSSILDDDIGSGSSLRRVRQKANLLTQREKKELGYPVFQPPDGAVPNLLLTNGPATKVPDYASVPPKSTQTANNILQHLDSLSPKPGPIEKRSVSTLAGMREKSLNKLKIDMLHGQALRSLEKVDSPKFLPSYNDVQKPVESELSFQSKNETEESPLKNLPEPQNINGDVTVTDTLKGKAPAVEITDTPLKATKGPQKKHAFLMSAPEGSFEIDDEEDGVHDNGHALPPLVENNKPATFTPDIIKTPASPEVSGIPKFVENNKPMFHEVLKAPEQVKLKEAESNTSTPKIDFGSVGGSVSEQGLGFKAPVSSPASSSVTTAQTSVFTPPTLQMEKTEPVKISPSLFSANKHSETKPDAGSDPKDNGSTSEFKSASKSAHVKFSVPDKGENGNRNENGNGNDGKSESVSPAVTAATSKNGIFSFGTPAKNISTPDTTPASNPPIFPSWTPSDSTNAVTATSTAAISTASASATISSNSVLPQVFSFGSGTSKAPTSAAETANSSTSTGSISPFAITTFATTTTTTATAGNVPFVFGSSAAATSNTATTGSGLFGFSSPVVLVATSTTNATGSGLFGVSSPAAATLTTAATGSGLFTFGSSAAAPSTAMSAGSGVFGSSSSAASTSTTTTTTTMGSSVFGFSSPAAATSTTTTGNGLFSFSSPAALTSTTTTAPATGIVPFGFGSSATSTSTTGSSLFSFNSPAAATSTTTSQSNGSFFNMTSGFQTSTNASSSSSLFGSSTPAFGSSPSFGITSVTPTSETKPNNSTSASTTSIFGSTWQQPQKPSGFGSTFSSPSPSVFNFGASSTPAPSFGGQSVFTNSTPVFGAVPTSPNNNNDQMSMEDSMAEDSMPTQSNVSPFGQAPVNPPGFMFGSATPTPTPPVAPFAFGGQPNPAPPPQNPFQSSSVEFNAGGGSFSLGSGGEKSNRRIVRVAKSKNRKK